MFFYMIYVLAEVITVITKGGQDNLGYTGFCLQKLSLSNLSSSVRHEETEE